MVVSAAVLLIAGGVCACAPLFKRVSKTLARLLVGLGFLVGIGVILVAIDLALGLNVLSKYLGIPQVPDPNATNPYLKYYLPVMAVLGILLFSRPIRNLRWASLIALGAGILAAAYLRVAFTGLISSNTVLAIVFIIVTLAVYTLLRFVEDILEMVGSILAFPPIAVAIGLVSIYFGILTLAPT